MTEEGSRRFLFEVLLVLLLPYDLSPFHVSFPVKCFIFAAAAAVIALLSKTEVEDYLSLFVGTFPIGSRILNKLNFFLLQAIGFEYYNGLICSRCCICLADSCSGYVELFFTMLLTRKNKKLWVALAPAILAANFGRLLAILHTCSDVLHDTILVIDTSVLITALFLLRNQFKNERMFPSIGCHQSLQQ